MLYAWAIKRFGFAGAAILGQLEFLDRAQQDGERPLASRLQLLAALEGLAGRNSVDNALKDLLSAKVITRFQETTFGQKNLETYVKYGLNLAGLAAQFETYEAMNVRNSPIGESRQVTESFPESGTPIIEKNIEKKAAAQRSDHVLSTTAHASPVVFETERKQRRIRPSGIVTWTSNDVEEAVSLESIHVADLIAAAVSALILSDKEPVPGRVGREIQRMEREHDVAEQKAVNIRNEASCLELEQKKQDLLDHKINALLKRLSKPELITLADASVGAVSTSMPMRIRLQTKAAILNREVPRGGAKTVLLNAISVVLSDGGVIK